jgi:hypothetical protein
MKNLTERISSFTDLEGESESRETPRHRHRHTSLF